MKEQYLNPGYVLHNKRSGVTFQIKEMIGKGSSCAVYLAECRNLEFGLTSEHLLKEYNPRILNIQRNDEGTLIIEPEEQEAFNDGLKRFRAGYKKQSEIRRNIKELRNETTNIQDIFSANGTDYIDMTLFTGMTYEKVAESSLYDIAKRIRTIARTIGCYHKAGYLHLDIKPENIFTIPETCELVMLFDFDSVVEKETVCSLGMLSYTKEWAAPEQFCLSQRRKICEATDLFAIGEILYYKVFNKHSSIQEHRSFSEYVFEKDSELFKNVNPAVFPVLTDIFRHTITTIASSRYQKAEDLIQALDYLINLADTRNPYLIKNNLISQSFFVGRREQIDEMHKVLSTNGKLLLTGLGGIGKTELAKQYAWIHQNDYDSIVFLTMNGGWLDLVNGISRYLAHCIDALDEQKEDKYWRTLAILKGVCTEKTLFIIDNVSEIDFENEYKTYGEPFLCLNARYILTSRNSIALFPTIRVGSLPAERLREIFFKWYENAKSEDQSTIDEIVKYTDYHTLTVELIAKQLSRDWDMTVQQKLGQLKGCGIASLQEKVVSTKDNHITKLSVFDHVSNLFDVSILSNEQRHLLGELVLIPTGGITYDLFLNVFGHEKKIDLNELSETGWVYVSDGTIRVHPIINEVVTKKVSIDLEYDELIERIVNAIQNGKNGFSAVQRRNYHDFVLASINKLKELKTRTKAFIRLLSVDYGECFLMTDKETFENCRYAEAIWDDSMGEESRLTFYNTAANAVLAFDQDVAMEYISLSQGILEKTNEEKFDGFRGGVHVHRGFVYANKEQNKAAINEFQKAVYFYKKSNNFSNLVDSLLNLAVEYTYFSDFSSAINVLNEAKDICNSQENCCMAMPAVYSKLAEMYRVKKEYELAEKNAREALKFCEQYDHDHEILAEPADTLAAILVDRKEYDEALKYCKTAMEIRELFHGKDNYYMTGLFTLMGDIYFAKGNYQEAERCYLKSSEICLSVSGSQSEQIETNDGKLGILYYSRKEYEKAELYFQKVLEIGEGQKEETNMENINEAKTYLLKINEIRKKQPACLC